MADTTYSMNQFRYNGAANQCMKPLKCVPMYLDWKVDTSTSPYYRDILLKVEDDNGTITLSRDTSYYFTFGVPRNQNYDLNFSIKLLQSYEGYIYQSTTTAFQFIRYISAKRTATGGIGNSLVCLYQINGEEEARSAIRYGTEEDINNQLTSDASNYKETDGTPRFFYEILEPEVGYIYYPNVLYHNKSNDTYWMFAGTNIKIVEANHDPIGEDNILAGTNDIVLSWSWKQSSTSDMAYYKIIITPTSTTVNFGYILLQLERISEDADIITTAKVEDIDKYKPPIVPAGAESRPGRDQSIYGRYIDLDQATGVVIDDVAEIVADTFKIYELKNLNGSGGPLTSKGATITRFGIWGHPELMMAINGEEIQVGSSGYYELNEFDVKSLCVVAEGYGDAFTLDYQYII